MAEHESVMKDFIKALHFSTQKHQHQRRKDPEKTPYINHPIEVAYILSDSCGVQESDVLVAAILHDTIEDTETTPEEIAEIFGERVRDLVLEVTDDKTLDKQVRKQLQIDTAADLSREAALIRIADKISNASDLATSPPKGWSKKRKLEYLDWTEQVVDNLKGTEPCLEEMCKKALTDVRNIISRI